MFEPRGHDMMSGSMLYPPADPQNDVGVLFIETSGCLPMCGHGLIGTITMALEHELIHPKVEGEVNVETPAGFVKVFYHREGSKITHVRFENVPAYLALDGGEIDHPDLGKLSFDVGYGGNFYAIFDTQENFEGAHQYSASDLITFSRKARELINESYQLIHIQNPEIKGLTHVLWDSKPKNKESSAANAVFYGEKAIDRSPCGTGTSARLAQRYAKGMLSLHETFIHESFIGTQFESKVIKETTIGSQKAIIPSIQGWARVTGLNTIFVDEKDPFPEGFQVI